MIAETELAGLAPWAGWDTDIASRFATPGAQPVTIGFATERDHHLHTAAQAHCDAAGRSYLPITTTARDIRVGPLVAAGEAGCADCLNAWLDVDATGNPLDGPAPIGMFSQASIRAPAVMRLAEEAIAMIMTDTRRDDASTPMRVLRVTTTPLGLVEHFALPHPRCARCVEGVANAAPTLDLTPTDARVGLRASNDAVSVERLLASWYDPFCGLVQRIGAVESSLLPMTAALFVDDRRRRSSQAGIGRDGTRQGSTRVAILEALERFAGAGAAKADAPVARYGSDPAMIDPADFVLHEADQCSEPGFMLAPYSRDLPIGWTPARNVATGTPHLVPEQLVFYGQDPKATHQLNRFVFEISNGCALGSSIEEATLYGLFEVLERDAFLGLWYARRTPVEIDLDSIHDTDVALLRARVEGDGFVVRAFDASTSRATACIVVAIVDPAPDAPFASMCASGAHIDPVKALMGALVEAASSVGRAQRTAAASKRDAALMMLADAAAVRGMEDHSLLYSAPEALARLDFLLHERPKSSFAALFGHLPAPETVDLRQLLTTLVEELSCSGYDVLVADQTFAALRRSGLHCVKVLVPGTLSMTFGHQYRRISKRRLMDVQGLSDGHPVNLAPHNFP